MVVPPLVTSPLSSDDSIIGGGEGGAIRLQKKHRNRQNGNLLEAWSINNYGTLYPTRDQKETLARDMQMSYIQVNRWFANRRRKGHLAARGVVTPPPIAAAQTDRKAPAAVSPVSFGGGDTSDAALSPPLEPHHTRVIDAGDDDCHKQQQRRFTNTDFWAEALQISAAVQTGGVIQKSASLLLDTNNNASNKSEDYDSVGGFRTPTMTTTASSTPLHHLPQHYQTQQQLPPLALPLMSQQQRPHLADYTGLVGVGHDSLPSYHHYHTQQTTPPALLDGGSLLSSAPPPSLLFAPQQQQHPGGLTPANALFGFFHQHQEQLAASFLQRQYFNSSLANGVVGSVIVPSSAPSLASPPPPKKNRLALLDANNLTENESIAVAVLADLASFAGAPHDHTR